MHKKQAFVWVMLALFAAGCDTITPDPLIKQRSIEPTTAVEPGGRLTLSLEAEAVQPHPLTFAGTSHLVYRWEASHGRFEGATEATGFRRLDDGGPKVVWLNTDAEQRPCVAAIRVTVVNRAQKPVYREGTNTVAYRLDRQADGSVIASVTPAAAFSLEPPFVTCSTPAASTTSQPDDAGR